MSSSEQKSGIEIDDNGTAAVTIKTSDGEETRHVDVYAAFGAICDAIDAAQKERKGRTAWMETVRDWLTAQGFPPCSLFCADRFASAIMAAVDDLKKKGGAGQTPNSPASTERPPSPSPPDSA